MVGVPKSTGCFICRKRKIRCDETWPSCVNCQKNGKLCPGQPATHTFKDLGPRLDKKHKDIETNERPALTNPAKHHGRCANVGSKSGQEQQRTLTQVNAKWAGTGAAMFKFRLARPEEESKKTKKTLKGQSVSTISSDSSVSPLSSPLSTSPRYELAQALVKAIEANHTGYSISAFGSFLHEIPRRIGHNAALDAAVTCLIYTRSAVLDTKTLYDVDSSKYYLTAVQKLQGCLEDPQDGMSSNTLCASVLLSLVETLAGPRIDNFYLAHVGGVSRLLELQGPEMCQDPFAKEMLHFMRGGIIIASIYRSEPCFLLSPEWRDIAFDKAAANLEECLYTDVLHLTAELSVLLKEVRELRMPATATVQSADHPPVGEASYEDHPFQRCVAEEADSNSSYTSYFNLDPVHTEQFNFAYPQIESHDSTYPPEPSLYSSIQLHPADPHSLLAKVTAQKNSLNPIGTRLTSHLNDRSHTPLLPSQDPSNILPTTYAFLHWHTAHLYTLYFSLSILINKTLLALTPRYDPSRYEIDAECRTLALEMCKMWKHAWAHRPLGACHMWLGFVVAYEYCCEEVQGWMLSAMNKLLEDQGVRGWRWTGELVEVVCSRFVGGEEVLASVGVR